MRCGLGVSFLPPGPGFSQDPVFSGGAGHRKDGNKARS